MAELWMVSDVIDVVVCFVVVVVVVVVVTGGGGVVLGVEVGSADENDVHSNASHRILSCPLARQLVVLFPIGLIYSGNFRNQRIVRIRVAQQRADR